MQIIILIWLAIFVVSLAALIKAADWLTEGISRFVKRFGGAAEAGVIAISLGTTLPELAAAIAAVIQGKPELAMPLAIGSSIANILLVVGIGALSAKVLWVKKEHIDLDLPLFCSSIAIFFFVAQDGLINILEGALMTVVFFAYTVYVLSHNREKHRGIDPNKVITPDVLEKNEDVNLAQTIPTRWEKVLDKAEAGDGFSWERAVSLALGGVALLVVSANFTIDSLVKISENLAIPAEIAAMTVLAIGVALPELLGILAVAKKRRYEMMMGNVFGATTINLLLVCGVAALIAPLEIDSGLAAVSLPFLAAASILLAISTFTRRVNFGEGMMYLFLYFLFFVKLFGLF